MQNSRNAHSCNPRAKSEEVVDRAKAQGQKPKSDVLAVAVLSAFSAQSQIGFGLVFLNGREWPAHTACSARCNLRSLKKISLLFFLHGAGKYGNLKLHVLAHCTG
jgi:hypothetical protein